MHLMQGGPEGGGLAARVPGAPMRSFSGSDGGGLAASIPAAPMRLSGCPEEGGLAARVPSSHAAPSFRASSSHAAPVFSGSGSRALQPIRTLTAGTLAKRTAQALLAAVVATSAFWAQIAYADEGQTGSGNTSLVLRLAASGEYGGAGTTGEGANPDNDHDGLGDNLAFTVPTRIDFTALPNGALSGPSAGVVYIENESKYSVHVSSLQVEPKNGWNIVADAEASSDQNSIDFQIGPTGDPLSAASYLAKGPVTDPTCWNMAARVDEGADDRVQLEISGHINNVSFESGAEMTFGQICWYVTPGVAV